MSDPCLSSTTSIHLHWNMWCKESFKHTLCDMQWTSKNCTEAGGLSMAVFTGNGKTWPLCILSHSLPSHLSQATRDWTIAYLRGAYFYAGDINPRWQKFERKFVNNSPCLTCNHCFPQSHCVLRLCGKTDSNQVQQQPCRPPTIYGLFSVRPLVDNTVIYTFSLFQYCVSPHSSHGGWFLFALHSALLTAARWGEAHVQQRLRLLLRCANIKIYGDYGITFYCAEHSEVLN